MAKKETKKVEPKRVHVDVGLEFTNILTLVSGDPLIADFKVDGIEEEIRVRLLPKQGGVPVDLKFIDMMAERYEKLVIAIKQANDKAKLKAEK